MVRLRITSGIVGEDRTEWHPGTEHDASDAFAAELVARRCAVVVVAPAPARDARDARDAVESRDPVVEPLTTASAPALTTRRGRR